MTQLPLVTVVALADGLAAVAVEREVVRLTVVVVVTGAAVAAVVAVVGAVAVAVTVVVAGALIASQPVMMTTPDAPAAPLMRRARRAG
jgi:hypothetical protein